jgi:hypothetical protein
MVAAAVLLRGAAVDIVFVCGCYEAVLREQACQAQKVRKLIIDRPYARLLS